MWLKEAHVIVFVSCEIKLASRAMAAKVSRITLWVPMCSLPWTQHNRWIPRGSMGCVHTHWEMLIIEGQGSPSRVQNVMQKIRENNRKAGKISWNVSQALVLTLKHDKIWAWWALDVPSKKMLERVWWCKRSKMESWSWTICCLMNCSNGKRHARAGGGRKSHANLRRC